MNPNAKIFCVGLHKTGTTSLLQAFLKLGIRTCDGLAGASFLGRADFASSPDPLEWLSGLIDDFQAFEDVPWPCFFKDLYEAYPDSYFILTTRSPDSWIKSCVAHFGALADPVHEWIYGEGMGAPAGCEHVWISRFNRHNEEVIEFFMARPSAKFLHINIDYNGPSEILSSKIANFLDVPESTFVWGLANSAKELKSVNGLLLRFLRRFKHLLFGKKSLRLFGYVLAKDYSALMAPSSEKEEFSR